MFSLLNIFFGLFLSASFSQTIQIELNNYPFAGTYQSTISATAFFNDIEKFDDLGNDSEISLTSEATPLPYKTWLQEKPAPLVIVVPGLGSHYRSNISLRLAQTLYNAGYSVLSTSNVFNFEFMESALTSVLPGYTPQDTRDLHRALKKILEKEVLERGHIFTKISVTGYSHGALHTLFLASLEESLNSADRIGFTKFVAVNPPIDPNYSLEALDNCYEKYKSWDEEERKNYYLNFVLKLNGVSNSRSDAAQTKLLREIPDDQAQVALGSSFRNTLRETFWVAISLGRLKELVSNGPLKDLNIPASFFSRRELYAVIEKNYSFKRYINDGVVAEQLLKNPNTNPEKLKFESGLLAIETTLRNLPSVRVFHNSDDRLMHTPDRLSWLANVMGERLTVFDRGGHLGNLYVPQFKSTYLEVFND